MLSPSENIVVREGLSSRSDVAAELHRIAKANKGNLTPEAVVKNAESPRSPIHKFFTWDDSEAAKKCRLLEAQMLIRSVKVVVETHAQDKPLKVRAFVSVKPTGDDAAEDSEERCYVPIKAVLSSEDYRRQMLEQAASELGAFRRKYSILKELSGVFDAVDAFQQKLNLK